MSITDIANRFGNTQTLVRQRLRLGRVAPEIREAYQIDDVNLETLMPDGMAYPVDHDQPVVETPPVENELPVAFRLPAAE